MASTAPASHLVEIADPPLPTRATAVTEMSSEEKLRATLLLAVVGLGLCGIAWAAFHSGYTFWGVVTGGLGALVVIAAFSTKGLQTSCPHCGAVITGIPRKNQGQGRELHCKKCYEYSVVSGGKAKAMDPAAKSQTTKFISPVFKDSVWPKACVACGEPPVRLDDLSKKSVSLTPALLGRLRVMSGSVSGVPYCDKHRDQIDLQIGSDKKMTMRWDSLRMMRRYLAANRNRQTF
jgi:hypothetical protein